jgi:phage regulator Rha-like protein
LIVCNETREHAIHDPAERHHPFKESVESRTQGMSAERFYDSQQKFDFLCNRSHKSIMEFAEAYCEQETARLRAELETEQQDYGRLVKVLEKAEAERDGLREALRKYGRHMPECTSAFIKLPCNCGFEALIAAAPTKETDSPK